MIKKIIIPGVIASAMLLGNVSVATAADEVVPGSTTGVVNPTVGAPKKDSLAEKAKKEAARVAEKIKNDAARAAEKAKNEAARAAEKAKKDAERAAKEAAMAKIKAEREALMAAFKVKSEEYKVAFTAWQGSYKTAKATYDSAMKSAKDTRTAALNTPGVTLEATKLANDSYKAATAAAKAAFASSVLPKPVKPSPPVKTSK
jgi:hypothetical protein